MVLAVAAVGLVGLVAWGAVAIVRRRAAAREAVKHAVALVDKMEWQVRSCQALGWLLGGTLAQLKAMDAQRARVPSGALAARIDSPAVVLVLPNLQPEIRAQIAEAHQEFLRALWGDRDLSPRDAAAAIADVWDPACTAVRNRY